MDTAQQDFKQEKVSIATLWKKSMIENYTNFSGRATRREYWFVYALNNALGIVLQVLLTGMISAIGEDSPLTLLPLLGMVALSIAMIIPGIALTIRRLHDTNRSGWWLLLILLPIIGWIALLVFYLSKGDSTVNDYGPPTSFIA